MKIYKSDVYTTIALILLVVCFTFPAIAFYKVPQKLPPVRSTASLLCLSAVESLSKGPLRQSIYTQGAEGDLKR